MQPQFSDHFLQSATHLISASGMMILFCTKPNLNQHLAPLLGFSEAPLPGYSNSTSCSPPPQTTLQKGASGEQILRPIDPYNEAEKEHMEYGLSAVIAEMPHLNQDTHCGSPPSMDIRKGNSHCCDVVLFFSFCFVFCSVLAFVKSANYEEPFLGRTSPI